MPRQRINATSIGHGNTRIRTGDDSSVRTRIHLRKITSGETYQLCAMYVWMRYFDFVAKSNLYTRCVRQTILCRRHAV